MKPLWVCPTCEMIGEEAEGERHMEETGHAIEQIPQDVSDGVRDEWHQQAAKRVAGLLAFAALTRRA